jgi:hypothetical protein
MDFGKCFRSVTHEGKVPGSIRRVAFRTPFIDALCVSFQAERGEKKKEKKKEEEKATTDVDTPRRDVPKSFSTRHEF